MEWFLKKLLQIWDFSISSNFKFEDMKRIVNLLAMGISDLYEYRFPG